MKKLFVGILVLVLAALWLAPRFISLDSYKQMAIERLEAATGKRAEILGDISLSLLPAPSVTVGDVRIANAKGGAAQFLATAASVKVNLAPLPLLSGTFELAGITLIHPEIHLETFADGTHNWDLPKPAANAGGAGAEASSSGAMMIARHITIQDGSLTLYDHATRKTQTVKPFDLSTDMESLSGPFTLAGTLTWQGQPLKIEAHTGQISGDAPTLLNAALTGNDLSLLYEGEVVPGDVLKAKGRLQLHAANIGTLLKAASPGMSADVALPIDATADIAYDGVKLALDNFRLASGDQSLSGTVKTQLSPSLRFDLALEAPELTLDALPLAVPAVEEPAAPTPSGVGLEISPTEDTLFPTTLSVNVGLKIGTLHYRSGKAEQVTIQAEAAGGTLVLHEASAVLPGDGKLSLFGVATRRSGIPRLEGSVELAGKDLRALLEWLEINTASVPQESLHAFALKGGFMASPTEIRFSDTNATFDNTAVSGAAVLTLPKADGELLLADITLRVNSINLDQYLSQEVASKEERELLKETAEQVYPVLSVDWLRKVTMDVKVAASIDNVTHAGESYSGNFIRMEMKPKILNIERVHTTFRGVDMDGKATLNAENTRPHLAVLFKAGKFDTAQFLGKETATTAAGRPGGSARWSRTPIDFSSLRLLDGTFELGFNDFVHRRYSLQNTVVNADLKDGVLNITKLQGKSFGGAFDIKGSIASGALPALALTYALDSIDLGNFLTTTADITNVRGYASVRGQAKTSGVSEYDFVSNLTSNNNIVVRHAEADGFDLNTIASAVSNINSVEDVINVGRLAASGGKTAFNAVDGSIFIKSGVLEGPQATFDTERAKGVLSGTVDLPKWVMNLLFNFSIKRAEGASPFPPVGLALKGDADAPKKSLDTKALEEYIAKRAAQQLLKKVF
ncbi:MAG: AsmA family protein [Alphaproteobacteria bacterium]|nr:AsmA family protein [Alphaproteobacteria bacterium]